VTLGQYLADIFSHLNIDEQEESIQQTTKQASNQKNRNRKKGIQRKKTQTTRKKTKEQQKKRTTTCPNQTPKISRNLKESGSHSQNPLQVMAKIEVPRESTLGSIEFKIGLQ
jgi:DNA polymerase I-like protein with 3'-5' exonuclease and polymerase domains